MHLSFILLASCASGVLAIANGTGTESPDFNRCYDEEIKTFNVGSQGSDLVCSRKDGSAILDPQGQPYATLKGCRSLCGDGYQLWPKSETGLRILWYITPIFLLAARYAYAPIGISNKIWTYIHLIGDPMDSLWSTLIRQEKARRNYHLALEIAPGVSREVAAIWTAYDLWWQDASETTEEELKKRVRSGVGLKHKNLEDTQLPEGLTFGEIYYIKKCALQLAKNRWVLYAQFNLQLKAPADAPAQINKPRSLLDCNRHLSGLLSECLYSHCHDPEDQSNVSYAGYCHAVFVLGLCSLR